MRHMSYDPSDCEFLVDSFGVASMQDYYALYASELERLQRIGSSYGLHTIASQYALYLSSSTESHGITHGYAVTPYFGTSETLDAYIANRASQKTISALGSTLLEYYAPGSETYILDITELCQYSPGVRLYDIDPDVMMRFSDAKWVYDEIRPLVQWHWPVKS